MATVEELKAPCACGSGKMNVECCGKDEACPCGAKNDDGTPKKASECCVKSPETHEAM